jgi:hypothetical protein
MKLITGFFSDYLPHIDDLLLKQSGKIDGIRRKVNDLEARVSSLEVTVLNNRGGGLELASPSGMPIRDPPPPSQEANAAWHNVENGVRNLAATLKLQL